MAVNEKLSKLYKLSGTPEFQSKVKELNAAIDKAIPAEARLPSSILDDLPLNVMGIPASCGLLSSRELEITDLDVVALSQKIAAGEYTAVETVTAFGKRAAIAHQLVHCLTDLFIEEGVEQAKALDEHFKKTGKVVGPFHGIPVSVKDHMSVKGRIASSGFMATLETSKEDGDQVAILRAQGAVFYAKTNQPQGVMHAECNSFWGRTDNPLNLLTSPGGSSGGASALVALKGSCMALGTDIGGSIRIPCAMTGIYGIRPSSQTMPTKGHLWYQGGWDGIICSTGPMCNSTRDVEYFLRSVLSAKPHLRDPYLIPVDWSPPVLTGKKIKVGIMFNNGHVMPHPPILRALEYAKEKLSKHPDIELVEYKPYNHLEGYGIAAELYFPEGRKIVDKLTKEAGEDIHPLTEYVLGVGREHDAEEVFDLLGRREDYRRRHLLDWVEQGCDVVLCPPFHCTACPHNSTRYFAYTAIWNITDYPGMVWPSPLKVDPAVDKMPTDFKPMSDTDAEMTKVYDAELMEGLPIAYQLVARKLNDQFLVSAQKIIEDIIKN